MKIFVGGLTASDSQKNMLRLVHELTKGPWYDFFSSPVEIKACHVYQMTDQNTGRVEFSAVLELASTRLAWELITKLDGLSHKGKSLHAHKWFTRKNIAERRIQYIQEDAEPDVAFERRTGRDRRRRLKIQSPQQIRTRAVRGFQRSHGA